MSQPVVALAKGIRLTEAEERARRLRNRAIGLMLAGLVLTFYAVTLSKLGFHLPFGG